MKSNYSRPLASLRGFTLIEILCVFVIIALLAALLFSSIAGALRKAEVAQAKHEVLMLDAAMNAYLQERYQLPTNAAGPFMITTGLWNNAQGTVFYTASPKSISSNGVINDPWGQPYWITQDTNYWNAAPNPFNPCGNFITNKMYAIFSAGPDMQWIMNCAGALPVNNDNITS